MADFNTDFPPIEDYSTSSNTLLDSDPTANFLAREQAVLGDDAAIFNANNSVSTSNELDAFPDLSSPSTNSNVFSQTISTVPGVGSASSALPDYSAFHSEFPQVEINNTQALYTGTNGLVSTESYQSYEEEPEIIRQWKERQREIIAKRDEESEVKRRETIAIARDAIDRFYEEYNEKKARAHALNKQEEEAFLRERDDLTSGTTWERICKQVDISNVQSKTSTKHVKDVGRFKELLLGLKKDSHSDQTKLII
ncbi:17608_t:CDS:2 [Cetraspora pellucida]|uniref:Clathrin light chain n=1 Tax=Cetraspora pellucida TaxID=1433469 RepID=A0A9N9JIE4_9GLOM|nr:17608_t:CDS:2 [Cetraspora pellucida]